MSTPRRDKTLLQISDVASLFAVSVKTVRRWTDEGRLPYERTPGGHRRYRTADVEALFRAGVVNRPLAPGAAPPIRRRSRSR